ncbi:hypothetical protein ACGK9R_07670 [Halomonas sp. HNIBRBA4712]|uniref:hypothetical protein n=1 Tax=Halomonas sp. HNIBRBA4712 TaxID=3373087 RepID=UPI003744EC82
MNKIIPALIVGAMMYSQISPANEDEYIDNITAVACDFEHLPLILMINRDGMGGSKNTLQIGSSRPVPLNIGSSMMSASFQGQEYFFSLRMPTSVTVDSAG